MTSWQVMWRGGFACDEYRNARRGAPLACYKGGIIVHWRFRGAGGAGKIDERKKMRRGSKDGSLKKGRETK